MPVGVILSIGIFVGVLVVSLFLVVGNTDVSDKGYWGERAYAREGRTERTGHA